MKRMLFFFASIIAAISLLAQKTPAKNPSAPTEAKYDVVLKVNGDELEGNVTAIDDSAIKFNYKGESLSYELKKEDILKITFASGRIEFFNKPPLNSAKKTDDSGVQTAAATGIDDHHNKVAILPWAYIRDNQSTGADMAYKVQNDVYTYLNKHSAGLTIVDPRTTNALLAKKGITRDNMMGSTMEEICNILGVEYVVEGTVTQNKAAQSSSSSGSGSATSSYDKGKDKTTVSGYSTSNTMQYYATTIAMNIYSDKNTSIYSQERKALFNTTDGSYDSPLEYLLKRCPLYRK